MNKYHTCVRGRAGELIVGESGMEGMRARGWSPYSGSTSYTKVTINQRLAANAKNATVLGSIPASSDTVESEGRQRKVWKKVHKKKQ